MYDIMFRIRDLERSLVGTEQADLVKMLIDEKESQILKNSQLNERIKVLDEREERLKAEIREATDQSELLEFRVLELEESQEKVNQTTDHGTVQ